MLLGCEREREREREREGLGRKKDRRKFGEAQNRIDNEECG